MSTPVPFLKPLAAAFGRLPSTYWFLPAIVTVASVALGLTLVAVDRRLDASTAWLGWAYGGGADGARALLGAVAGSTITVVSVTFSVMVVALTVSSQHFGPRLLNSFMRDKLSQLVLGTFTGTFAYCLVVLRTVQGDGGERYSVFVPHLAITGSVALTLLSVAMLIYYVHHVAMSMQVSEITLRVARDLESSIERLYPDEIGEGAEAEDEVPPIPEPAIRILSNSSGYVQAVDSDSILRSAAAENTVIWLIARPGQFVIEDLPLAAVHPGPQDLEAFSRQVRHAYVFGPDRTSQQDVAFAAQQLVEVALRALSPGVNEPFTAFTCIDRLGQGFAKLARRRLPGSLRGDSDGNLRVLARPRTFADLAAEAFEPIVLHAGRSPIVLERLFDTLQILRDAARRDEDLESVLRLEELTKAVALRELDEPFRSRLLDRWKSHESRSVGRT